MPQLPGSSKKRAFYRQSFELKNNGKAVYMHTLLVNPQDMTKAEPARINVQQTLGGAYVSHFGQGLHQVTISGTTGYSARYNTSGELKDGYTELKAFQEKVYRYYVKEKSAFIEMFWYNWEDEEYYKVVPTNFRIMRNKSEPTLYRYELTFVALEPVGAGQKPKMNLNALDAISVSSISNSIGGSISSASEVLYLLNGGRT